MTNFSLLVQKKYNSLATEHKQIFIDEYKRKKKSKVVAFILWFFFGWHYAYLKKWGWLILFIFTAGGFFIWWVIDLFRVSKMVNEYNNNLALEILRDITLMFGENKEGSLNQETENLKNDVNAHYLTSRNNSEENYLWFVLPVLIVVFFGVSAYTKPDRLKMENTIISKMVEYDNSLFEEKREEYTKIFITNYLKSEGYNNIVLYESNWLVLRKLEIIDSDTSEKLINAYGFLGMTFVNLNYKNNREVYFDDLEKQDIEISSGNLIEEVKDTRGIEEIKKDFTWLYSKNEFVNNLESKNYRILKLEKGDVVNVLEYGMNNNEMIKVNVEKNGILYEGYIIPTAISVIKK